jgi:hypothetical protein
MPTKITALLIISFILQPGTAMHLQIVLYDCLILVVIRTIEREESRLINTAQSIQNYILSMYLSFSFFPNQKIIHNHFFLFVLGFDFGVFEAESCYRAQVILELELLLFLPPECWVLPRATHNHLF